jgi:mono/diheme cytochrome c family protein
MPSNNLDFAGFVSFLLGRAATDPRLTPANLVAGAERAGADFGPVERLLWLNAVGPRLREGLLERRHGLMPLLEHVPPWGPGRVDTFNPYKMLQLHWPLDRLGGSERFGTSDFPSIFLQGPRDGMQLHWDGNNRSLAERNLSAAIGAGVTPETVDHASIRRVSDWLLTLRPPPSPHRPDPIAVARGRIVYARSCAACHGFQGSSGYVFSGRYLGRVTPIEAIGTDRGRLDSYTEAFRQQQLDRIFEGTPYDFRYFTKTHGYANQPLDGLWLRAPYLHNGSVPTLAALLEPPARRPAAFLRGFDIIDHVNGGFLAPACDPAAPPRQGAPRRRPLCYDTRLPGNGNGGHLYGTVLPAAAKADLLAYLRTF